MEALLDSPVFWIGIGLIIMLGGGLIIRLTN